MLLDHRGKPVSPSRLNREQAGGSVTSVRSPYEPMVAPGLTPKRLQSLLARAKEGDHADYLSLASEMEQRDGHYFSQLQTRRLAVEELERTVEASSDDPNDVKVADAVESWLFSPSFGMALAHVLDATAKGFSVTEIVWARGEEIWRPVAFKHRPQRWFSFERERVEELRLNNGTPEGEKLEPYKHILHVPNVLPGVLLGGGLARIVAAMHVFKGYAVKDWMAFAEVFGMPVRIGFYNQGASEQDKDDLREAVTNIGSDAAAVIPDTMRIEFERAAMSGSAGGDEFFKTLAEWLDSQTSKVVLGQTMTSDNGSSLAQAQIHNEVRKDIRNSDAWQLANTIQRDLVVPFVDLNFGKRLNDGDYPLANFDVSEPEDLESLAKSLVAFIDRGLPVSQAQILEKFGLSEPTAGEPLLGPAAKPGFGSDDDEDEDDDSGSDDDAEDKQATAAELRMMLARIGAEAERSTNMRQFRRQIRDLLRV